MDELERVKAEKEESDRRVVEAQAERDRVLVDAEAKVAIFAAGVPPSAWPRRSVSWTWTALRWKTVASTRPRCGERSRP